MMNELVIVVCAVTVAVAMGCNSTPHTTKKSYEVDNISHTSSLLRIEGWSKSQVVEEFGEPSKTRTDQFGKPRSGWCDLRPERIEEQWNYDPGKLQEILVYFRKDKVIFAIKEWSSW